MLGRIPESVCVNLLEKYQSEQKELSAEVKELEANLSTVVSSAVKIVSDILSRIFLAAVSCVIPGKPHFFTAVSAEHQSAERSDKSGFGSDENYNGFL